MRENVRNLLEKKKASSESGGQTSESSDDQMTEEIPGDRHSGTEQIEQTWKIFISIIRP